MPVDHPRLVPVERMASDGLCVLCDAWEWCSYYFEHSRWDTTIGSIHARESRRDGTEEGEGGEDYEGRRRFVEGCKSFNWNAEDIAGLPRNPFFASTMLPRLGRPSPSVLFPALCAFIEGTSSSLPIEDDFVPTIQDTWVSPPVQRLLHVKEVVALLGESVDLVNQIHNATDDHPIHIPSECEIAPWFYNLLKGSSYDLVTQGILLQVLMRRGGATDADIDDVGRVLDLAQPVETAYHQVSHGVKVRDAVSRPRALLKLRKRLDSAFSPARNTGEIFHAVPEASSPPPPAASLARDSLYRQRPPGVTAEDFQQELARLKQWLFKLHQLANDLEKVYGVKHALRRNTDGIPTLFWSSTSSTEDVLAVAVCAFYRCTLRCDHGQRRSTTSPATVLLMWVRHCLEFGDRDFLTGCVLDYSMTPHSWRSPTLVAHDVHDSAFNFGWSDPYPTSLAQYTPEAVNGRVELARWNLGNQSARFSALEACLMSTRCISCGPGTTWGSAPATSSPGAFSTSR